MTKVYQNWKYRADIKVTNPSSTDGFQASFSLSWLSGMRKDFRDIRFASVDGQALPYWIESKTDFTSAVVWVKLPANDKSIKLYYGNGAVENESSIDGTMEFGDEFSGSSIDSAKWTASGKVSVSNGKCVLTSTEHTELSKIVSTQTFDGYIAEFRFKPADTYQFSAGFCKDAAPRDAAVLQTISVADDTPIAENSNDDVSTQTALTTTITGNYHRVKIYPGASAVYYYIDDVLDTTISTNVPDDAMPLRFASYMYDIAVTVYVDYVFVRKYAATEPTLTLSRKQPNPDFQSIGYLFSTGPETSFTLPCIGISLGPAAPRMVGEFPAPSIAGISIGPVSKIIQEALILPCSGLTLQDGYSPLRDRITLPCSGIKLSLDPYGFREYADLSAIGVEKIEIARSINDSMWTMNIETAGEASVSEFMHVFYEAEDAAGNSYHVFSGIVPTTSKKYACAGYSNQQTAYDYGYYLSRQYLPLDCLVMNLDGEYTSWDQWISKLLDETGIRKYKIITCEEANSEFIFTNTTTKLDAIKEICEYTGFLFYVGWINGGTEDDPVWEPAAWFVNEADIDDSINGLDLPNPVTITWPAGDLVDLPRVETPSDEKINRVRVRGTDGNGNWYSATLETPAVTNGRHMPVEYLEYPSPYATTETGALARATALYNYFTANVATVEATFIRRPDLQLWQKIQFSGSEFPDVVTGMGWLRIISIRYSFSDADETVTITAVQDRDNSILLSNTDLLLQDSVSETELIVDSKLDDLLSAEVGTVISIDGDVATVETESGKIIKVRIVS